jgi:hypothetical protein
MLWLRAQRALQLPLIDHSIIQSTITITITIHCRRMTIISVSAEQSATCMLVCCVVLAVCGVTLSGARRSMACAAGSAGKSSGNSSNAAAAIEQGLTEGLAAQESLLHQVHPSIHPPVCPSLTRALSP